MTSRHVTVATVDVDLVVVGAVGGGVALAIAAIVVLCVVVARRRAARSDRLLTGDQIDMASLMQTPMLAGSETIDMPLPGTGGEQWDTGIVETEDFAIL
jgi:hypothetical protein|tara:strand:+ start:158 stop:454 length:297 start_codon:yes stop_codon:yes gene_type:complete